MLRVKNGEEIALAPIRAQIRFDFHHEGRQRGFLFRKRSEDYALEERERQVALLKNVPYQGITVEEIDSNRDIYTLSTAEKDSEVAFAPVEMMVRADSIEDLIAFTFREELRKIKIIEPAEMVLSNYDMERAIFKIAEEYRDELQQLDDY
jgi:prolyl oligopeptidase PreP (S9A serine peptidase family)